MVASYTMLCFEGTFCNIEKFSKKRYIQWLFLFSLPPPFFQKLVQILSYIDFLPKTNIQPSE